MTTDRRQLAREVLFAQPIADWGFNPSVDTVVDAMIAFDDRQRSAEAASAFDQGWKACVDAISRLGHLPPNALPDARAGFLHVKPRPDVFGGVGE